MKHSENAATWRTGKMIKSELIQKISADNPHLFQRDVERIINPGVIASSCVASVHLRSNIVQHGKAEIPVPDSLSLLMKNMFRFLNPARN